MFPLIHDGRVIQLAATKFDVAPELTWWPAQDGVQVGDTFDGTAYASAAAPIPAVAPQYVPLATIRDRVTAAGKWPAFAAALDGLPPDKRWHLLTLSDGVSPDDEDAIALLTAVGCDPTSILAAE